MKLKYTIILKTPDFRTYFAVDNADVFAMDNLEGFLGIATGTIKKYQWQKISKLISKLKHNEKLQIEGAQ